MPHDAASLAEYRQVVGGAVDVMIGRGVPPAGAVKARMPAGRPTGAGGSCGGCCIQNEPEGEEVPAVLLQPKPWNQDVVIWINREGKQALFDAQGDPQPAVAGLLGGGTAVLGVDLFGQGEFTADGKPLAKARLNKSGRGQWAGYAGYTYGYNQPLFSQRVHDILSAVGYARNCLKARKVHLVGLDGAGHWVLAARAQAGAAGRSRGGRHGRLPLRQA